MIDLLSFKNLKYDENKLIDFGFIKNKSNFVYTTKILDGGFDFNNKIKIDVFDEFNEKLTLFYVENNGNFVGKINDKCNMLFYKLNNNILNKILLLLI